LFAVSQRTGEGFLSRIGGVLAILAIMGLALFSMGYGGYPLWVGHSGTAAHVTLVDCRSPGRSRTSDCSATSIQADGTARTVTVHDVADEVAGAWPPKTVDVRVLGDQAFLNTSSPVAVGMVIFGVALVGMWPVSWLLRSRRSRAS
jgi:hypothetical protein